MKKVAQNGVQGAERSLDQQRWIDDESSRTTGTSYMCFQKT